MIEFPNYKVTELVFENEKFAFYRGHTILDENPVFIKLLKGEYPSPEQLERIKHEYDIVKNLRCQGTIIPYSLEKYKNSMAIIFEDFNGLPLTAHLTEHKVNFKEFLVMASKIADVLGIIHEHRVIHKDLKPSNILWNAETKQVKIIDFEISTVMAEENIMTTNRDILEGTLAYISPEQTGRMNRDIDYRTDYYSLGVVFYEMLTGRLPFEAKDPMELLHAHLAITPPPPPMKSIQKFQR